MKLYAKVSSERASKGQGGNEFLTVSITADKKTLFEANVVEKNNEWVVKIWDRNNKNYSFSIPTEDEIQRNMQELAKDNQNQKKRLEYLRKELRAERISYGELAELQSLIPYIDKSDTELLEASGVPEFTETKGKQQKGEKCKICDGDFENPHTCI